MERHISYRQAPPERWIRHALPTTKPSPLAWQFPLQAEARVWEEHPDLLLIETLAAIESCSRLLAQCALDLRAVERRLYSVQQSRWQPSAIEPPSGTVQLSKRELQVLRLVVLGLNNQAIGAQLGISGGTVKNHMTSILAKLAVRSRYEAVFKAQSLGLL